MHEMSVYLGRDLTAGGEGKKRWIVLVVGMESGSKLDEEMGWLALRGWITSSSHFDGVCFHWKFDGTTGWATKKGSS